MISAVLFVIAIVLITILFGLYGKYFSGEVQNEILTLVYLGAFIFWLVWYVFFPAN